MYNGQDNVPIIKRRLYREMTTGKRKINQPQLFVEEKSKEIKKKKEK